MARIESLGHVGIYAEDLMKMRDFYSRVLGLTISDEDLEERGISTNEQIPYFTARIGDLVDRDDDRCIRREALRRQWTRTLLDTHL